MLLDIVIIAFAFVGTRKLLFQHFLHSRIPDIWSVDTEDPNSPTTVSVRGVLFAVFRFWAFADFCPMCHC